MPKFEIIAPNGKTLEIEGETMPSEQELDDIFKSTNTLETNTKNNQQLNKELFPGYEKRQAYEETIPGNILDKINKTLDLITPGQTYTSLGEQPAEFEATKGMDTKQKLLRATKQSLGDTASFAQWALPIPKLAKGKGLLQATKTIAAEAGLTGLGQGALQLVKSLSRDKKFDEAINEAVKTAVISGAIQGGAPQIAKAVKEVGKQAIKAASNVRGHAIDIAIKNPDVFTTPQPRLIDMGQKIKEKLDDFAVVVGGRYEEGFDKLNIQPGLAIDAAKNIRKTIQKYDMPIDFIKSNIKMQTRANGINLSDNAIDRFVKGGNIDFEEARKINRALGYVERMTNESVIGGGGKSQIATLKSQLLDDMEKVAPSIKKINKAYSKATEFYQRLNKKFKDPQTSESLLNTIGAQLSGVKRAKTGVIDDLKILDKLTKSDLTKQIPKSLAAEEFERQGMTNLMDYLRLIGGGGIGGYLGGSLGSPMGAGIGAIAGLGAAMIGSTPQATKLAIQAGKVISSGVQSPAGKTLFQGVVRGTPQYLLNRKGANNG